MKTPLLILAFLLSLVGRSQSDSILNSERIKRDSLELEYVKKHEATLMRCDSLLSLFDFESLKNCRICYESILRVDPDCWTAKVGIAELVRKLAMLAEIRQNQIDTYITLGDQASSTNPELAIYYYKLALKLAPNYAFIEQKIETLTTTNSK